MKNKVQPRYVECQFGEQSAPVNNEEKAPAVGPYSGLTREELRQSGTCETDWY